MKQILTYTAVALALASCANDSTTDIKTDDNSIRFDVITNMASRAATDEVTSTDFDDFYVYATESASTSTRIPIQGAEVKKSNGAWNFNDGIVRYWPQNAIDFFGINFYYDTNSNTASDTKSYFDQTNKTLVVPDVYASEENVNAHNRKDLLCAYAQAQTKSTSNGTVTMPFCHALSAIEFKVQVGIYHVWVFVDRITIKNLPVRNDLIIGNATVSDNEDGVGYTSSTTGTKFKWVVPANDARTASVYLDSYYSTNSYFKGKYYALNNASHFATYLNASTSETAKNLLALNIPETTDAYGITYGPYYDTGIFYVTPNKLKKWTYSSTDTYDASTGTLTATNSGTYIVLTCRIYMSTNSGSAVGAPLFGKLNTSYYGGVEGKDILIPIPDSITEFAPNKKYVFTINFSETGTNGGWANSDNGTSAGATNGLYPPIGDYKVNLIADITEWNVQESETKINENIEQIHVETE